MNTNTISYNAFTYGAIESIGQTAVSYTLTAARWGVLTYDFLTQPQALQTYSWIKEMTIALGQLTFWSVVWAYAKVGEWVDNQVASALPTEPAPPAIAISPEEPQEDPFDQPALVAAIPAATAPVATPATDYASMTSAQLRKVCSQRGITWRNAHGKGRHFSKGEMIAALTK
jgi:hypothetical protein